MGTFKYYRLEEIWNIQAYFSPVGLLETESSNSYVKVITITLAITGLYWLGEFGDLSAEYVWVLVAHSESPRRARIVDT